MPDDLSAFYAGELVFNGINAVTGNYGQPPLSARELARLIRGAPLPEDYRAFVDRQKQLAALTHVESRLQRVTDAQLSLRAQADESLMGELRFKSQLQVPFPMIPGAGNPSDLANAGWAVIFSADMHPGVRAEIKEALQPLLDLRHEQAGQLFQICEGSSAYRSGERKDQFCDRLGIGPGLVDPREFPFYVLLVGTPEEIPYSFQYQLDVMRAVGRLDFGSDIEAYAAYAETVVAAESGITVIPRRAAFWAPVHAGDKATEMSARLLVQPLFESLGCAASESASPDESLPDVDLALTHSWESMGPLTGPGQATRDELYRLLGGAPDQVPALLFTAGHGIEFPANHPAQLDEQGALLCQDWPGLGSDVLRDHYFAAEDVAADADLTGLIAVFFACYGAGTPQLDQFAAQAFKVREKIAPRSFTAALPQRLLKQGALAVLGHVERAWGYSFISPQGRVENQAFVTAMRALMNGDPIGVATDLSFNMRYAEMSSDLSADLEELKWDPAYLSENELAYRWTSNNDARSYVVIGDPAARLPVSEPEPELQADLRTIVMREPEAPVLLDAATFDESVAETAPDALVASEQIVQELETEGADEGLPAEAAIPLTEEAAPVAVEATPPAVEAAPAAVEAAPAAVEAAPAAVEATAPVVETAQAAAAPPQLPSEVVREEAIPAAQMARPEAAIGYGLEDEFDKLKTSLKAFTDQLATSLGNAAEDIVTLDVRTYSTADITAVAEALDTRQEVDATLRALTRVAFDGDLQVYMPEKADKSVDQSLWSIHKAMVEEAQHSRANFLATMAELATRLLDSLKIGI